VRGTDINGALRYLPGGAIGVGRALLDRTLIWNQRQLLHALREYEQFYNEHRSHQGITNARPLHPLPAPIADPDKKAHLNIRRRDGLGGIFHEYQHAA
jgi:hypothetical protein